MLTSLGNTTLRTGEIVEATVVRAPDADWAERVERMLRHKGDPWNWQNSELLRGDTSVTARFFLLHRGGVPFANIMLVEEAGVALLGHVWTEPADRRTGASSILMECLLQDFAARGGRALFLGTDFDGAPWHYYRRRGFEAVEPGSHYMARYETSRSEFERSWFSAGPTVIEPLDWAHWPTAAPLCLGESGGTVRLLSARLLGRASSEGTLLPLIRDARARRAAGQPGNGFVLRESVTTAVFGIACRQPHPLWPETDVLDVFCHPCAWPRAGELLAALRPDGRGRRQVACVDAADTAKQALLVAAGLRPTAALPRWAAVGPEVGERVSVTVLASE
jgi:GNAT superfamily N-acetyltransferase